MISELKDIIIELIELDKSLPHKETLDISDKRYWCNDLCDVYRPEECGCMCCGMFTRLDKQTVEIIDKLCDLYDME